MKKGFTLIELLAVIVILAIIALIATPIIFGIIEDAKENSNKRSIDMYGSSVEQAIAKKQMSNKITPGFYETQDGKTLTLKTNPEEKIEVEYSGSKIVCDAIQVKSDGTFYLGKCKIGTDIVDYNYGELFIPSVNKKPLDIQIYNRALNHTNTWKEITYSPFTVFHGAHIWTDGADVYHSVSSKSKGTYSHYILKGDTWEEIEFKENNLVSGSTVWSDGTNVYSTYKGYNYILK